MDLKNAVGFSATVISTVSLLPQVVRTWKTKSTKDLSLSMTLLGAFGTSLWLTYGILLGALPVIVANALVMMCFLTLSFFKLKYK